LAIKPENYFFLKDGSAIKSLFELSKELDRMPEDVFRHHANDERNDFSNWVRDVIGDRWLADKMMHVKDKKNMKQLIVEKIQRDVVKEMEKNMPKRRNLVKEITQKPKQVITEIAKKPNIIAREMAEKLSVSNTTEEFKKKVNEVFSRKESHPLQRKPVDPTKINYGIKCPYKTIHCGILEFVFGIIIGLLAAFVLAKVV